ncbi:hypothetical protein [Nostoc sp.]
MQQVFPQYPSVTSYRWWVYEHGGDGSLGIFRDRSDILAHLEEPKIF